MKFLIIPVALGSLLLTGCGKSDSTQTAAATNAATKYDSGNPLTAPADYLGAVSGLPESYFVAALVAAAV